MDKPTPTPKPRYRVIAHKRIKEFEAEVNELLKQGYELHGDMITASTGENRIFQAFVLKPTKKKRSSKAPKVARV